MKRFRLFLALFVSLLLLLLLSVPLLGNTKVDMNLKLQKKKAFDNSLPYKPNEVIVKFKSSADSRKIDTAYDSVPLRTEENTRMLKLKPGASVENTVKILNSLPEVEYAEPNYRRKTLYTPSDPKYPNQYGLNNTCTAPGFLDTTLHHA